MRERYSGFVAGGDFGAGDLGDGDDEMYDAPWDAMPGAVGGIDGGFAGGPEGQARFELADVRRLARRAVRGLVGVARADERPTLSRYLREHLGSEGAAHDVVAESWAGYEHVNVQLGLDAWLAEEGRTHRLVGVSAFQHRSFGLAELFAGGAAMRWDGPRPGNVARGNLPTGPDGEVLACIRCGIYLVDEEGGPTALLLRGADPESGIGQVTVQIMSAVPERAGQIAAELRRLTTVHNVFRHQVLSFAGGEVFEYQQALLRFHHRPTLTADALVLPADTLEAVRRQVVETARHKDRLLAAGQHLKRGLLLHGPPGVGKTHTIRYLMSSLTETTVVQVTGESMHLIGAACSVARALQPSMVVVEDVDLIAEDRGEHPGRHPLLFQLLNEMDGLEEDADVVFVLTTNRPDLLEPALASRPGRVDQAVELQLPDLAARRRLFDLYRGRLEVDRSNLDDVLARAEGVTASFVKELLRRAAVLAASRTDAPETDGLQVAAADLDEALEELLSTRNTMTRVLLGVTKSRSDSGR
jgi:ATPase family associated with various cellular activities (AAA)